MRVWVPSWERGRRRHRIGGMFRRSRADGTETETIQVTVTSVDLT